LQIVSFIFVVLIIIFSEFLGRLRIEYKVVYTFLGHTVAQFVDAVLYKPECRELIPGGVIGMFHCRNPSDHTVALGLTQFLTE
jgi:hypothetical protein